VTAEIPGFVTFGRGIENDTNAHKASFREIDRTSRGQIL
jgi:hypothetical protein